MLYLYSIFVCLFFLYIFSKYADKLFLLDFPNQRKIHSKATPTIGGLSIFLTIYLFFYFLNLPKELEIIVLSSSIVLIIGLIDDVYQIGVSSRFIAQFIASLIVIGTGLSIVDLGNYSYFPTFNLGSFGILLTVFSILCLTNAINFIDGLDGLSSGLLIIAFLNIVLLTNFFEANTNNNLIFLFIFLLLIFFLTNIGLTPLPKIFMGDAGSTTIGFVLGWIIIYYTHPDTRAFHPVLAIWIVSLPMYDLLAVILRRTLIKKNPLSPDKKHIHHILLNQGFSSTTVLLILLILSLIINISGFSIYFFYGPSPSLLAFPFGFLLFYYCTNYFFLNKVK